MNKKNQNWLLPVCLPVCTILLFTMCRKEIRTDLQKTKNFAIVPIAIYDWEFDTTNNAQGWTTGNVTATVTGGSFNLTTTSTDPLIISPDALDITASGTYKYVQISMKNNTSVTSARIFFTTTADTNWTQAKSRSFPIGPNTTAYSNYIVDMSTVAGWTGTIKRIRIDPLDPATGSGQTVNIDYIKITETIPSVNEWYFDTDNNSEGWTWGNATATVSGGTLNVTTTSSDPLLTSPDNLGITAPDIYKYVHVELKNFSDASSDTSARIFFITTTDPVWNNTKSKRFPIKLDSSYYGSYIVDMSTVPGWTGTIRQIRVDPLDPASKAGKKVKIDLIQVTNNQSYRGVMSPQQNFTSADADTLKNIWRANIIRWQIMQPTEPMKTIAAYRTFIDNEIAQLNDAFMWCEPLGIKILIDLHYTPLGSKNKKGSDPIDTGQVVFYDQQANNELISTWVRLVNLYKDKKSLFGYGLINEPIINYPSLTAPGCDYRSTITKLGDTIRSIDRKTPIFVAAPVGDNPSGFNGLTPFPFTNIVYETHMYENHKYTLQHIPPDTSHYSYPGTVDGVMYNKARLTTELDAVHNFQTHYSTRIYVGEFSVVRWANGAATWLRDCIDIFEGYGWSWTYHAYKESGYFDLQFDNSGEGTAGSRYTGPGFTDRYNQVVGYGLNLNH